MTTNLKPKWTVSAKLNPHNIWIGVYWDRLNMKRRGWTANPISFYICPLPCLCIKVERSLLSTEYVRRRGKYYLMDPDR